MHLTSACCIIVNLDASFGATPSHLPIIAAIPVPAVPLTNALNAVNEKGWLYLKVHMR